MQTLGVLQTLFEIMTNLLAWFSTAWEWLQTPLVGDFSILGSIITGGGIIALIIWGIVK